MGTYNLDEREIADAMEKADVDSSCEGDYTEEAFIKGAQIYINRLRRMGASIPKK